MRLLGVLARLYRYEGYDEYYEVPTVEEMESWYGTANPGFDPLGSVVVETSRGEVVGYAIARSPDRYRPGVARLVVDPGLPEPLYREALTILLRWSGEALVYRFRSVNPATLYVGREYSRTHISISSILGGSLSVLDSAYLMEYSGVLSSHVPPGFDEEVVIESPGESTVGELAEVVNDASSVYRIILRGSSGRLGGTIAVCLHGTRVASSS